MYFINQSNYIRLALVFVFALFLCIMSCTDNPIEPGKISTDTIPPTAVTDFVAINITTTTMLFTWTAPGDDSISGRASSYIIKISTTPLTDSNWTFAESYDQSLIPDSAGHPDTLLITALDPQTTYYIGLISVDEAGNMSGLSNTFPLSTLAIFKTQVVYQTGNRPLGVYVADFDGDGYDDLVVNDYNDYSLSIYKGVGDGSFNPRIIQDAYSRPGGLIPIDVDRDNDMDIAVSDFQPGGGIRIIFNNGNMNFSSGDIFPLYMRSMNVTAGDINNDSYDDIVSGGYEGNKITVLLNNTDSVFNDVGQYNTGYGAREILLADLNNDGFNDIVTANEDGNDITVLINNHDTTFSDTVKYYSGNGPYSVDGADLDSDGDIDLVVANYQVSPSISIFFNNGDGTFPTPVSISTETWDFKVKINDYDLDGDNDILVSQEYATRLLLLLNNGSGNFNRELYFTGNISSGPMCTSDFDNDGDLDVAVVDLDINTLSIFINQIID